MDSIDGLPYEVKGNVLGAEMKRGMIHGVLAAALLSQPVSVLAARPFYFHKPSVDRQTFGADLVECSDLAGGVKVQPQYVYSPNLYAVAATAFLGGILASREKRKMRDHVLRTCMGDKGYRRFVASSVLINQLKRLKQEERIDLLFLVATTPSLSAEALPL